MSGMSVLQPSKPHPHGDHAALRPAPHAPALPPTCWSGADTGPFATPALRPLQRAALSALRDGGRIAQGGLRGVDADDAQHVTAYPTPTVRALLRFGFIEEDEASGVYRATDHGLRALEVLPAW